MINEFSVGLMPLEDTDWTRGKCSYKMLQYMACGKPVIVSPVGVNKQLLNAGNIGFAASKINDWLKALIEIKNNPVEASEKGKIGRRIVEDNFSCTKITPQILEYFKSISL
jgi:glycosyltransferase involved in cell wall biosynthesis